MEYVIIEENEPEEMGKRVEGLLNDGWELHGNLLFVAYDTPQGCMTVYAQALTKKDP